MWLFVEVSSLYEVCYIKWDVFCNGESQLASVHYVELARQQKVVAGSCHIEDLPRLQQALLELGVSQTQVESVQPQYRLQGLPARYFGEVQLPMLQLHLHVELPLVCQRCFEAMPQEVDETFEFAICGEPPEALLEEDDVDWLEPDMSASVEALVEDELLMALPIAVMHEHDCVTLSRESGEKPNPFAALKALKLGK